MPGSTKYSMNPSLDEGILSGADAVVAKPTLIKKQNTAPELYQAQDFNEEAWRDAYLLGEHGKQASKRDIRRTNRYFKSEKGLAEIEAARNAHIQAERQKELASYRDLARATVQPNLNDFKPKLDVNLEKPTIALKPKWIATNADVAAKTDTYTVKAGNTLGQIVADYNKKNGANLNWQDVAKWSGIADPSKMQIGHIVRFTDPNTTASAAAPSAQKNTTVVEGGAPQNIDTNIVADSAATVKPDSARTVMATDSLKGVIPDSLKLGIDSTKVMKPDSVKVAPVNQPTKSLDTVQVYNAVMQLLNQLGVQSQKRGGTLNRINYFQQGGAVAQQDIQQQIVALVQAAMQGDQKATDAVNKIIEAAKKGDQQAIQLAQMIQQVVEQMQGQATSAKWGSKLNYIKSLKYAKGGKTCPACEKKVEMKACGGKKAKKHQEGGFLSSKTYPEEKYGYITQEQIPRRKGNVLVSDPDNTPRRVILEKTRRMPYGTFVNDTLYFRNASDQHKALSPKYGMSDPDQLRYKFGTIDYFGNPKANPNKTAFESYLK